MAIKIVVYGNGSGAQDWRLQDPFKYFTRSGKFDVKIPEGDMDWMDLMWADIIVVQGLVDKLRIAMIYTAQQEFGKKIVVEFDDYIRVEKDSPFKLPHTITDAPAMLEVTMKIADMVTTTTPHLAKKFSKFNKNIKVLPNYMDMERWDLVTPKNDSDKIRIFWAGSMTHMKDLGVVIPTLKKLLTEYPNLQLVILGEPRLEKLFKGYNVDITPGQPKDVYPIKLHAMRFDIGIAPLRDTFFNKCKSYIKPLEYGICGVPCVASDVEPYQCFRGKIPLAKTKEDWYNHLKNLIEDGTYRRKMGMEMYDYVKKNFDLSQHIGEYIEAYESLML